MIKFWGFLGSLFIGTIAFAETKINVCSITINSNSEINVFKNSLDPNKFNFIELTPKNKNPIWLKEACQKNITCDQLIISGHFGGVFFSETNSLTLDLEEMLTSSCNNGCSSIFQNVKEVFLFGCNTLAHKDPDHRTYSQYLQVLVNDGISREYAEPIVATRYSQNGLTMSDYFTSIFPNAKRIYGFKSTGPLGAQSSGRLQNYFKSIPNYYDYLLTLNENKVNANLAKAYSGTSFVQTKGSSYVPNSQRDLICKLYSSDSVDRNQGFNQIVNSKEYDLFFNTLLSSKQDQFSLSGQQSNLNALETFLEQVIQKYSGLREIQYRALRGLAQLDLISLDEFRNRLNLFIESILSNPIDAISFDQICTIAQNETISTFDSSWISKYGLDKSVFLPRLISCFHHRDANTNQTLLNQFNQITNIRMRSEIIRALPNFPFQYFNNLPEDLMEESINSMSTQESKNALRSRSISSDFKICIDTTSDHWNCWIQLLASKRHDYNSCLYAAENSTGDSRTGLYWQCLTQFPNQMTLSTCLNAAKQNTDPESSDDMRWFCWTNLRDQKRINQSECYGIARSMVIKGNRIKQNWNCNKQQF